MSRRLKELFVVVMVSVSSSLFFSYLVILPIAEMKIAVIDVNGLLDKHTKEFAGLGLDEQKNSHIASVFAKSISSSVDRLADEGYVVFEKAAIVSDGALDITDDLFRTSSEEIFERVDLNVKNNLVKQP